VVLQPKPMIKYCEKSTPSFFQSDFEPTNALFIWGLITVPKQLSPQKSPKFDHCSFNRGRRVPLACFALPDMFLAVPMASVPVFIFCTPGLVLGGTEGVGSRFYVLRSHTHFGRYRGCQVPFSFFCTLEIVLGDIEGVGSNFNVLRSRTHLGWF
jgi:hypothetical protein